MLLYYFYTDLNSSIICLFSGDTYLSFGISISFLVSSFCEDFFETLLILSAILLPIKSPVTSAAFWICLFEVVFIASVVAFLALSRSFWVYLKYA